MDRFAQLPLNDRGGNACKAIQPHNLHITLHFLGQVSPSQQECYHRVARRVDTQPFTLVLDHFDHFHKARIFWLGPDQTPDGLYQLHSTLGGAFTTCGFTAESRRYRPHVTLLRKCRADDVSSVLDDPELVSFADHQLIHWQVNEFVLLESVADAQGVNYQVVEKYPLACDKLWP